MTKKVRWLGVMAVALMTFIAFQQPALAGPPLICHPFEIGKAASLPWGGSGWRDSREDYDVKRLADDAIALLTPETAIIVRMETLRRAAIYAQRDAEAAEQLLNRLEQRALKGDDKKSNALAWFDAGYLKETYAQATPYMQVLHRLNSADSRNGYSWVLKAIELSGGNAEMEFAAALITSDKTLEARHGKHFSKAVAGAREGSLLAHNLVNHFSGRGRTLSALRTLAAIK